MSKILIGVVTYEGQKYCVDEFLDCLKNQTKKADVLFVVNNGQNGYVKFLKSKGVKVVEDKKPAGERINKIVNGREYLRKYAIENDYDYLFFVDSDVMLPSIATEALFMADVDVITGLYLNVFMIGGQPVVAPVLFRDKGDGEAQLFTMQGVQGTKLIDIGAAGLGCTMISRKVFEKIPFRFFEKTRSGEDMAFYVDARKEGFKAIANTAIKCVHRAVPKDDPKSEYFEWPIQAPSSTINVNVSSMYDK